MCVTGGEQRSIVCNCGRYYTFRKKTNLPVNKKQANFLKSSFLKNYILWHFVELIKKTIGSLVSEAWLYSKSQVRAWTLSSEFGQFWKEKSKTPDPHPFLQLSAQFPTFVLNYWNSSLYWPFEHIPLLLTKFTLL